LLKHKNQNPRIAIKISINVPFSFGVILKISPTNNAEYFEKLPPLDKITKPSAVLVEENTDMIVSVEIVFFLLIRFKRRAKTTAKIMVERLVSDTPRMIPMAIPVNTECPNASEKKASLLLTIMVPNIPNNGVIIITASNAFFIKSYVINSKGSIPSIIL
jgi:hypothetical protein